MYENVFNADVKQHAVSTAAMHHMMEQADVVLEQDVNGICKVTKPEAGYKGIVEVPNAHQFAVDHPEASVLFIQYAGGFTRYNFREDIE